MTSYDASDTSTRQIMVELDAKTYDELMRSATEQGVRSDELVTRWVRERLAHESERRLGRARQQRPEGRE